MELDVQLKMMAQHIIRADLKMIEKALLLIKESAVRGGKIIIAGNGGSAAIASHVAVDLTKAAGIRAINFNEADLITCFANDYGYAHWLAEALKAYADPGDIVILISSSGKSENIINAAQQSRAMGLKLVTFSGFQENNPLRQLGDVNCWVESSEYNVVEMAHQAWLLVLVDKLAEEHRKGQA